MRCPRVLLLVFICLFVVFVGAMLLAQSNSVAYNPVVHGNLKTGPWNALPDFQRPPVGASQFAQARPEPQNMFGKALTYGSGSYLADSIATGDLNGDGIPDLVVANQCESYCAGPSTVGVLLGNGDGAFQPAVTYNSGGYSGGYWGAVSVVIADVNGDGHPDLIVANYCQTEACDNAGVSVLLGNGDGTFQPPVSYDSGFTWAGYSEIGTQFLAAGDLRGDGRVDLIVTNSCQTLACNNGQVSVLLGNGDGTFQPAVVYNSVGAGATGVAVADLNGDGNQDVVVGAGAAVAVMLGNGDGTLQAPVSYNLGLAPSSIAISDLNGDGTPDLVAGSDYATLCFSPCADAVVFVLLGNGDGTFQPATYYSTDGWEATSVAIGDMNGDGKPDLVVSHRCPWLGLYTECLDTGAGQVSVLLGNGNGTFQSPTTFGAGGQNALSVAIADVNGDGRPDMLLANQCAHGNAGGCNSGGIVGVLFNEFTAKTTTHVTSSVNPSQVNQPVTFTVTVSSGSSVPNGSVITFYNGATEIGTGATTEGVASLTTSFSSAGKYTIKASYPGDAFHEASSGTVKQVVKP